jgi:selenocysteine lyase/cysteine desulfurase
LGTINPITEKIIPVIQKEMRECQSLLVDAAQSASHTCQSRRKRSWIVISWFFQGHKMYGPSGIGVLWAKQDIIRTNGHRFSAAGNMIEDRDQRKSNFFGSVSGKDLKPEQGGWKRWQDLARRLLITLIQSGFKNIAQNWIRELTEYGT